MCRCPNPGSLCCTTLTTHPSAPTGARCRATSTRPLGAVGVATDGTVRDIDEVEALGFQFFAKEISASHAYVHLVEIGIPVTIGGLTVNTGDLLHGDKHGVTNIPFEIAEQIPDMVQTIADYEQQTIGLCQSPEFSLEALKEVAKITRPY